jgi:hypothetical protein
MLPEDDAALHEALQQFLEAFEAIFDRDWAYSREQLGILPPAESEQARAALLTLLGEAAIEPMPLAATFLHPASPDDLGSLNWGNYERLLACYVRLRKLAPPRA